MNEISVDRLSILNKEWHKEKNGDMNLCDFKLGSRTKAWWICSKGHEYESAIYSRASGRGCPFCAGKKVCRENSFAANLPELAKQWDTTKNGELTPERVTVGSKKVVWWICEMGHSFQAAILSRKYGSGCPYCSGRKINRENCLSTTHPDLASSMGQQR